MDVLGLLNTQHFRIGTAKDEANGKGKVHPITAHEGTEGEKMYNSILSLTSALDEVSS